MKTAISVPDDLFREVESRVADLKTSRSEFFATAAAHYLRELDRTSITLAMNEAIAQNGAALSLEDEEFLAHNRRLILEMTADDEW